MADDSLQSVGEIPLKPTWIDEEDVPPIIREFLVQNWSVAHYRNLAKMFGQKLKFLLEKEGVDKCSIQTRAKQKDSLEEKLKFRHKTRNYQDFQAIKKDIVDLVGVRVILYMPSQGDHKKVKEIIQNEWGYDIEPRLHPQPRKGPYAQPSPYGQSEGDAPTRSEYQPMHLGYRATHYVVPMKENEFQGYNRLEGDQVEVQVVSALSHAWAEVEHDITYKGLDEGPPSIEEERILDALNGLIQSGDLLLEQFQNMYIERTSKAFEFQEDLTRFLRGFFRSDINENDPKPAYFPRKEGRSILFEFLKKENQNTPRQLRRELNKLGYPSQHHGMEEKIRDAFSPTPKLASNMSLVVCVTRSLLPVKRYEASPPSKSADVSKMCSIMMSALKMLELCLGGHEEANEYLQKMELSAREIQIVNFLLGDDRRYETLRGKMYPDVVRGNVEDAWKWFSDCARDKTSFCGFLFRLAEMGCRKEVTAETHIHELRIQPLLRSDTSDDTGVGAHMV